MNIFLLKNENKPYDNYRVSEEKPQHYQVKFKPLIKHTLYVDKTVNLLRHISYDLLIITSQRSVECIQESVKQLSPEERNKLLLTPVYTVGEATAAYLDQIGFVTVEGRDTGNGNVLCDYMIPKLNAQTSILYLTGEIRKDTIPKRLSGHNFTETPIYDTTTLLANACDLATDVMGFHWIVFFSPQGTEKIVEWLQHNKDVYKIGVIGPTTNEYLLKHNIHSHVVCEKPNATSLYRQIKQYEASL